MEKISKGKLKAKEIDGLNLTKNYLLKYLVDTSTKPKLALNFEDRDRGLNLTEKYLLNYISNTPPEKKIGIVETNDIKKRLLDHKEVNIKVDSNANDPNVSGLDSKSTCENLEGAKKFQIVPNSTKRPLSWDCDSNHSSDNDSGNFQDNKKVDTNEDSNVSDPDSDWESYYDSDNESDDSDQDSLETKTKNSMRPHIIKSFVDFIEKEYEKWGFWKVSKLGLNDAEIEVIMDTINNCPESTEKWISGYLFQLWRTQTDFKIIKSSTEKDKILKELSGYEEKLDIRSINPTFYGFYEVFKSSKDLFDMIFEHALYETKMYLHNNFEKYQNLDGKQFYEKFEEMLLPELEKTFNSTFENCVYKKFEDMLELFKNTGLEKTREVLSRF